MKTIDKIPKGANVTVSVILKGTEYPFDSNVAMDIRNTSGMMHGIAIDPLKYQDKQIFFGHYDTYVKYHDDIYNRQYKFKVHGVNYKFLNKYYALYSDEQVNPLNTRRAFRISCGWRVTIQRNDEPAIQAYCKDISYLGTGVILTENYIEPIKAGDKIKMSIYNTVARKQVEAFGIVVRSKELPLDKNLIGIEFGITTKDIAGIVNQLQAELLKRQSRYNTPSYQLVGNKVF